MTTNTNGVVELKQKGIQWIEKLISEENTTYLPGSFDHLLYGGDRPKDHVIKEKLKHFSEFFLKEMVKMNVAAHSFDLTPFVSKNDDLLIKDDTNKQIIYILLNDNLQEYLERRCATTQSALSGIRFTLAREKLQNKYSGYDIQCMILNWTIYNRTRLNEKQISIITRFERGSIQIIHMQDFLKIIGLVWEETDFYEYFREIGNRLKMC